jgi:hypothetical protein
LRGNVCSVDEDSYDGKKKPKTPASKGPAKATPKPKVAVTGSSSKRATKAPVYYRDDFEDDDNFDQDDGDDDDFENLGDIVSVDEEVKSSASSTKKGKGGASKAKAAPAPAPAPKASAAKSTGKKKGAASATTTPKSSAKSATKKLSFAEANEEYGSGDDSISFSDEDEAAIGSPEVRCV